LERHWQPRAAGGRATSRWRRAQRTRLVHRREN